MYQFIERLHTLYGLLQDEQSKEIFQARLALDMDRSILNFKRLVSAGSFKDRPLGRLQPLKDELKKLNQANKKRLSCMEQLIQVSSWLIYYDWNISIFWILRAGGGKVPGWSVWQACAQS